MLPTNNNSSKNISINPETTFIDGITLYAQSCGSDEATRLAQENVYICDDSVRNYINLKKGNVLLMPDKDEVIGTNLGRINLGAQAQLFLIKTENELVIYDLFQTKPKQITVNINHQKIVLAPGSMLVLTGEKTQDFENLKINCHTIACSNVKKVDLDTDKVKAFIANFSVASAITTVHPLMRLTQSNNRQDKLALEKLVRSIVMLGESIDLTKTVGNSAKEQELSTSL